MDQVRLKHFNLFRMAWSKQDLKIENVSLEKLIIQSESVWAALQKNQKPQSIEMEFERECYMYPQGAKGFSSKSYTLEGSHFFKHIWTDFNEKVFLGKKKHLGMNNVYILE